MLFLQHAYGQADPAWIPVRRLQAYIAKLGDGTVEIIRDADRGTLRYVIPQTKTRITSSMDTPEEARRRTAEFVDAHPELFHNASGDLEPFHVFPSRRSWHIVASQRYLGIEVLGGYMKLWVRREGDLLWLEGRLFPAAELAGLELEPLVTAQQAMEIALAGHEHARPGRHAPSLWIAFPSGKPVLAWQVYVEELGPSADPPRHWRSMIAADTGGILEVEDLQCHADVPADVKGRGIHPEPSVEDPNGWLLPDVEYNPVDEPFPLPRLNVDLPSDPSFCDETDDASHFLIQGVSPGEEVCLRARCLSGCADPLFEVIPIEGDPAVHLLCGDPSGSFEMRLNMDPTQFSTSQINAFVWTERSRRFADQIYALCDLESQVQQRTLVVKINSAAASCQGGYNWNDFFLTFYKAQGDCVNTAYSTFVAHEFGHHFTREVQAGDAVPPPLPPYLVPPMNMATAEGCADTFAAYMTFQPVLGQDYKGQGTYVRDLSECKVFPSQTAHEMGWALAGSFWDLLKRLDPELDGGPEADVAFKLFGLYVKGTFLDERFGLQLNEEVGENIIIVDAEEFADGDPGNGSPHKEDIVASFHPHNLYRLPFVRGDANIEGVVDVSDPVVILNYLFDPEIGLDCLDAGDTNNDNGIDIGDAILLLNYLFEGGEPPGDPFPECGRDPPREESDRDDLTCEESACPD